MSLSHLTPTSPLTARNVAAPGERPSIAVPRTGISTRGQSVPQRLWDNLVGGVSLAGHIGKHLPRGWWAIPCAGFGLLLMLASGRGLAWFVGKYAWTGKDFQEIVGPSLLAGALCVAVYLWWVERSRIRGWLMCLPAALLCRELHFSGTGTGIYVALVLLAIHAIRNRRTLQPLWDCELTTCLWLGAASWYALAVSVDSGVWKFLPHAHWWTVNLEETLESGGHLAILSGVLASVLMGGATRRS